MNKKTRWQDWPWMIMATFSLAFVLFAFLAGCLFLDKPMLKGSRDWREHIALMATTGVAVLGWCGWITQRPCHE